ncbi:MAG TPA: dockerin type I repeat-containing protein, partial [Longimicrobium sp.]|nr:dockerin type I repeat-containing protein [Longimicrobium sp.]
MQNSGTAAHDRGLTRLRMAAVVLGALAVASCADAFSPRAHDRDGTVVQLSPGTRAELASPAPGTLELRFVPETGSERVQSFQGEIRFKASRYRVLSATTGEGATASWHLVEPGRIRFAGVATEGITGRGISFRFEESESFEAGDFQLVIEEALLRSDLNAAAVRFAGPETPTVGSAPVPGGSGARKAAQAAGAPAAQAAVELRGDVNGDGGMDAVDALAVLAHVVGRELPTTFAVQPQGDVSRDGAVTAADALLILEYRVGRDRVVDVRITSPVAAPVDVADSLVLSVELRGVRGELLSAPVQWSCPDTAWVRECGPRLYRPAIRSAPSPVPVRLVASSGGVADTLQASVFERDLSRLRVDLTPYPASVSSDNALSQQRHAIRALSGGTTAVYAIAQTAEGMVRPREFRVLVQDTTLFTAAVGKPGPERTQVVITGRRAGSGILTVLTNGVSVPVRVEVAAPAALACSPGASLSLDLAPGEIRTFRGSDPGAPGCLDFRAERDRGRQYLVLTYVLPYSTGRSPNAALELFDFEGQALFYGAGEAIPAEYPVFRFYTPDVRAASLAVTSRGAQAAQRAEPGHTWRVGGSTLREGRPRRERAVRELRPGAGRGGQGPRLNVSGATGSIQAGDTLVSGIFASLDRGVRTSDGAPASDRAVVTHVGENLIVAEHLDVLRGRLIGADGRTAARIPDAEYTKIDAAYGRPKRQLDRLFGGPYTGTVAGRSGGGRELAVNMPLQSGVWGYAHGDLTTINYWNGSWGGQPSLPQIPLNVAEQLLAHVERNLGEAGLSD